MLLSDEQVKHFEENGFLIAEGILTEDDLMPVQLELEEFIGRRARELHGEGKITDLFEAEPFDRRAWKLHEQCPQITGGIDIMQMRGEAMFEFLRNPNLMGAVSCLIGPEISCNPIQHLRAKMPAQTAADVPWHQDLGVTWEEADESDIITTWIPLVDATRENGCMEIIPGVHKIGYLEHTPDGGTRIRPDLMPEIAPVCAECPRGGVIFLHNLIPHRGLNNHSETTRWSMDLRYQTTGLPSGRPAYPDFPTYSESAPDRVLTDHGEWCRLWIEGLEAGKGKIWHRQARREALAKAAAEEG